MVKETLDEFVEELADRFGIYGCGPDGDHQPECQCRVCYVIGIRERILEVVKDEVKGEVIRIERARIADYLIAHYGGVGRNASRTAMYAVAKGLALDLTLRNVEVKQ